MVTDTYGNLVSGAVVNFSADNGATIAATGTTGTDGSVLMAVTSTVAGLSTVTASHNGSTATTGVSFVADSGTAGLTNIGGGLSTVVNNAVANNTDTNSVKAVVTDKFGNLVKGAVVRFSSSGNEATISATGITGVDGSVTMTLTSPHAKLHTVTASINGSTATTGVRFVADSSTAVMSPNMTIVKDGAVANGSDTNSVMAVVIDKFYNPVSGAVVNFSADNGATIAATGTTGADGSVTVTLTSTTVSQSRVTASYNNSSVYNYVSFVADSGTGSLTGTGAGLSTVKDRAVANGSDTNSVKAVVTDQSGNPVSGA
ncbi:invasin, partial [Salmonella enterica subsp. enterica]|nr:invasin [Salmonella enterica subsp. enterica serovar Braenderup]